MLWAGVTWLIPDPSGPFFLIIADLDPGRFCVEGRMIDDRPWRRAAQRAKEPPCPLRAVWSGPAAPMSDQLPAVLLPGGIAQADTALVAGLGEKASWRYVEFFAANTCRSRRGGRRRRRCGSWCGGNGGCTPLLPTTVLHAVLSLRG